MDSKRINLPPQDIEAEKSVLSAIIMDSEAMIKIAEILEPQHFYYPSHQEIYVAMQSLYTSRSAIDVVTLSNFLKKNKKLESVGGLTYLTEIASFAPTSTNIEDYASIVKESGIRRQLITLSNNMNSFARDEAETLEKILDEMQQSLFGISEGTIKKDFVHVSELLEEAYERAEELDKDTEKLRGIKTGFKSMDAILGGFQGSDLIILAARPSVGKTSMALDIARSMATEESKSVGVFSLEMSNMQLMDRLLAMQLRANLWDLRMGKLPEEVFENLAEAMGILSESNIYIDDTPGMGISEMRTKARRMKLEKGIDILFVDYLQLMHGNSRENRVQEVSEISRFLKVLAKELDIPVVALSQLSRAVESRTDRRPQLSDLRESGSIEQDADIVMFIHREELYNKDTDKQGIADIIIAKHRNGPIGQIELAFVKEQARFAELEKFREEEG